MPNLLVQLSDKLGTVLDVVVVGFLIGSTQLPALNAVSPFVLFSSIIYSLYGQGGSLLAIKAKSVGTVKRQMIFLLFQSLAVYWPVYYIWF